MRASNKEKYTSNFALGDVLALDAAGWETGLVTAARLSEVVSQ